MKLVYILLFINEIERYDFCLSFWKMWGMCECLKRFCMFMILCKVLNYYLLFFVVIVYVIIIIV